MNRIHVQPAANGAGLRALDDSNRSFLSIGSAAERQDCLSVRNGYDNFVMHRIVTYIVHRSRKFAGLTVQCSNWGLSAVRQPGEYRNLRMGHSVGYENLLAFGIVADRSGIADHEADCSSGSSSYCS